ncbi:MAG: ABC transporter permease subunit [Pirellulales bacterium]
MADRLIRSLAPFWLIGVGALAGLLTLVLIWGVLALVHRRTARLMLEVCRERVIFPFLVMATGVALYTVIITLSDASGTRFFDQKAAAINSVFRMHTIGSRNFSVNLPANTTDKKIDLDIPSGELNSIELSSELPLIVVLNVPKSDVSELKGDILEEIGSDAFKWTRPREPTGPWAGKIEALYVTNESERETQLSVKLGTQMVVPQASVIPYTACGVVVFVIGYLLLQLLFPRISAVAMTTGKEAVSQPLFYLLMSIGIALCLLGLIVPYFTFGEDIKMYKTAGFDIIKIIAMFLALWTASVTISEEVEGRTALTVLSKPITRQQFILGKYVGIGAAVLLLFMLLGGIFSYCVSYKVVYDARETVKLDIGWQDCHSELVRTTPGLILTFMESMVLAAVAVAISTRLGMLANLIICLAIYAVGHLVPLFVQSSLGEFAIVKFMAQLTATILPGLEHYNIGGAIMAGRDTPLSYLGWAGVYSAIYIAIAMLLALLLFDDRDLA